MSNYYSLVKLKDKTVYSLGTKNSARQSLPLLLLELDDYCDVVLYGDETHAFLEDKYEYNLSFEKIIFDSIPSDKIELIKRIELKLEEFDNIFEENSGEIINSKALKNALKR